MKTVRQAQSEGYLLCMNHKNDILAISDLKDSDFDRTLHLLENEGFTKDGKFYNYITDIRLIK